MDDVDYISPLDHYSYSPSENVMAEKSLLRVIKREGVVVFMPSKKNRILYYERMREYDLRDEIKIMLRILSSYNNNKYEKLSRKIYKKIGVDSSLGEFL